MVVSGDDFKRGFKVMKRKDGYIVDVSYPFYFYKEIQPLWLSSVIQFLGSDAPDVTQSYSYCELGCGAGLNLIIAATVNPCGHFIGVDFNENHIAIARDLATHIGLKNIEFIHTDFKTFAHKSIASFDFIVCHGTWSWIAPAYQKSILEIVSKSLKSKGIFYLHYMCHPGSASMIPIQKLLHAIAHDLGEGSAQTIQTAMNMLKRLTQTGLFRHQPELIARLASLDKRDINDLAHEFLSDFLSVHHSVDIHQYVAQAGVCYLGSADVFENIDDSLSIPSEIQPILAEVSSPSTRETLKDIARNQRQRGDLFQRDPVTLSAQEHLKYISSIIFKRLQNIPLSGDLSFDTPIGRIEGSAEIFLPILEKLAEHPTSFKELARLANYSSHTGLLFQALQMLMWNGSIHPVSKNQNPIKNESLIKLNKWLQKKKLSLKIIEECATAIILPS